MIPRISHYIPYNNEEKEKKERMRERMETRNKQIKEIIFLFDPLPCPFCGCPPLSTLLGLSQEEQLPCEGLVAAVLLDRSAPCYLNSNKSFLTLGDQYHTPLAVSGQS